MGGRLDGGSENIPRPTPTPRGTEAICYGEGAKRKRRLSGRVQKEG